MIRRSEVDLAIWTRRLPTTLAGWLGRLDLTGFGCHRWELPAAGVTRLLRERLRALRLPPGPGCATFAADLAGLAIRHAALTGSATVQVRLEAIDHDACRKFHTDAVGLRLITTYAGPGTQWLDRSGGSARMRQLAAGHVGLFKGSAWDGGGGGILHRSPPMDGSGRVRLLAVVDAVRDADDDGHWHH